MQKIEIFLNSEKILEYTYEPGPERFAEVYKAIKTLWPSAVIQFPKEKKDVQKVST